VNLPIRLCRSRGPRSLLNIFAALGLALGVIGAQAETLLDESFLLGSDYVPAERAFNIASPGNYRVQLSDLGFPSGLQSVKAAVTRGSVLVASVPAAFGSADFQASAGGHKVLVAAIAGNTAPGTFGVAVQPVAGGATVLDYSDTGQRVAAAAPGLQSSYQASFSITTAGNYRIALTDFGFPAGLAVVDLLLTGPGGTQVARLSGTNPIADFAAVSGNYSLLVFATADALPGGGLYSVRVTDAGLNTVVFATTRPVGTVAAGREVNLPLTGPYTLKLTDLQVPAALASANAVLVRAGTSLARLDAAGATSFNASSGGAQLFSVQAAAPLDGSGVSQIEIASGVNQIADVLTVTSPDLASGLPVTFDNASDIGTAGPYRVELADFEFPAATSAVTLTVVQSGQVLGQRAGAGTLDFNAVPGKLHLLVTATPSSQTRSGLIATRLTAQPAGTVLAEKSQAVGILFQTRYIDISKSGSYDLSLTDLAFPAAFSELALAVTRGPTRIASIYGGGKVTFQATAGRYELNFLARINTAAQFGAYGLKVETTPPLPVITLSAVPTSVKAGETTRLTWSSTGATSCVASDAWSGAKAVSGSLDSAALNVDSKFTLTCTGPGGQTSANVTVVVKKKSGSGGGGSVDPSLVVLLLMLVGGRISAGRVKGRRA
jgi:hypothetical protein